MVTINRCTQCVYNNNNNVVLPTKADGGSRVLLSSPLTLFIIKPHI